MKSGSPVPDPGLKPNWGPWSKSFPYTTSLILSLRIRSKSLYQVFRRVMGLSLCSWPFHLFIFGSMIINPFVSFVGIICRERAMFIVRERIFITFDPGVVISLSSSFGMPSGPTAFFEGSLRRR